MHAFKSFISNAKSIIFNFLYHQVYPYARRKDAGYLSTVLSDYASFSENQHTLLVNYDEVQNCFENLKIDQDASAQQAEEPPDQLQLYMRQLFQVEKAVLAMQNFPQLIARTPQLIGRLRIIGSAKMEPLKQLYEKTFSEGELKKLQDTWNQTSTDDDKRKKIEEELRTKLAIALDEIQLGCAQTLVREDLFLGQHLSVIFSFLTLVAILALASWLTMRTPPFFNPNISFFMCHNIQLMIAVAFFGLLGSFTSVMRRMRDDVAIHGGGTESTFIELTALAYGGISVMFSLGFGIVFALVLMLIFASNITGTVFNPALASNIFPTLPLSLPTVSSAHGWLPPSNCDWMNLAKLLLWSFIAGFAEQLVPDALDRLTKKAGEMKKVV